MASTLAQQSKRLDEKQVRLKTAVAASMISDVVSVFREFRWISRRCFRDGRQNLSARSTMWNRVARDTLSRPIGWLYRK